MGAAFLDIRKKLDARAGFQYPSKKLYILKICPELIHWDTMVTIGIFLNSHLPCDFLLAPQARQKIRKSMNSLDFITAEKINLKKNSVKSEKTQEKIKKTQ